MSSLCCFSQEMSVPNPYPTRDFSPLVGKVKGLSDDLLSLHIKLYEGYVKNTNMLLQMLSDMRQKGDDSSITFGALIVF